jgi:hypothetical protein
LLGFAAEAAFTFPQAKHSSWTLPLLKTLKVLFRQWGQTKCMLRLHPKECGDDSRPVD